MSRPTRKILACLCAVVLSASMCEAQLIVTTEVIQELSGVNGVMSTGDAVMLSGDTSDIKLQPAALLTVKTEAANVEVDAEDRDRRRVEVTQLDSLDGVTRYLIRSTGKVWVDVVAIDFQRNIYKRESGLVVDIPAAPPLGPNAPTIEPPSAALQELVLPIGKALVDSQDKAFAMSSAFQGFADGVKIAFPSSTERLWLIHGNAFKLLEVPPGPSVGSLVDKALIEHAKLETKDGKVVDRPLTETDRVAVEEVYRAVAWGALQK